MSGGADGEAGQGHRDALSEKLDEMTLHDETGDPRDQGYMAAVRELRDWHARSGIAKAGCEIPGDE